MSDFASMKCWADSRSILNATTPIQCDALGIGPLGLCHIHASEILGTPWVPPMPYTVSPMRG